MDSLEVYTILYEKFVQGGSHISTELVQVAYQLLNNLVCSNKQIEPNWGPFQTLVDDFLCSVADIRNTAEAFKQVFRYFFNQQRFAKAAGCYYRLAQRQIQEVNVLKSQNDPANNQTIAGLLQQIATNLGVALSIARFLPKQGARGVSWGYSVQGANQCLIHQLQQQEQQLLEREAVDQQEVLQKQEQLNNLQQQIAEQRRNVVNEHVEECSYQQLEQLFVLYESKLQLVGGVNQQQKDASTFSVPGTYSEQLQSQFVLPLQCAQLSPFETFCALVQQGNADQALTMMQKYRFSAAIIVQRIAKQLVNVIHHISQPRNDNYGRDYVRQQLNMGYKLQFNQNLPKHYQITVNQNSQFLQQQTEFSEEIRYLLNVLGDVMYLQQTQPGQHNSTLLSGQTAYYQFADDFMTELILSAAIQCGAIASGSTAQQLLTHFLALLDMNPGQITLASLRPTQQQQYRNVVKVFDLQYLAQMVGIQTAQQNAQLPSQPQQLQQQQNMVVQQQQNQPNNRQPSAANLANNQLNIKNAFGTRQTPTNVKRDKDWTIDDLRDKPTGNAAERIQQFRTGAQKVPFKAVNDAVRNPVVNLRAQQQQQRTQKVQTIQPQQLYGQPNIQQQPAQFNVNPLMPNPGAYEQQLQQLTQQLNQPVQSILKRGGGTPQKNVRFQTE